MFPAPERIENLLALTEAGLGKGKHASEHHMLRAMNWETIILHLTYVIREFSS